MEITCPHCNFSKSVDSGQIPDHLVKARCPKCNQTFSFNGSSSSEQIPPADPLSNQPTNSSKSIRSQEKKGTRIICPHCGTVQSHNDDCLQCGLSLTIPELQSVESNETYEYAGFWIRFVAYMIDSFIIAGVQLILTLVMGFSLAFMGNLTSDGDAAISLITSLFAVSLGIAYAVFFIGYCGQTPGKMALRIKVIMTDGNEISYKGAVLREVVGKFISGILFCIGYLMIAFDSKKQGLHDRLANTYVIKL